MKPGTTDEPFISYFFFSLFTYKFHYLESIKAINQNIKLGFVRLTDARECEPDILCIGYGIHGGESGKWLVCFFLSSSPSP